ncbi:MAG: FixH family protein [Candidatus Margulisbacteria bacterium]|nr:FixH family protein [Candidatus Margulisiibacteriota bacterium]
MIGLILGWSILNSARQITKAAAEPNILPAGQKIKINDRYSFQCVFPRKPRLGAAVLKINVFDAALPAADKKTAALIILAGSDMPAMRGHHAAPPQPVKTNKNKDYLFPVDLVMRGEWEIVLSFQENDREIYRGVILLKV